MATPTLPFKSRRPSSSTQSSSQAISEPLVGPFKKLSHIGKGSFAEVYRGIHIEKKACVAIKSVNMSKLNKKLKENLLSEITILRSLHHPHIVALIDCQETPSKMHIIMEFCELGDLSAFIKKRADLANHPETRRMIQKYPNPAVGGLNEVVVRHFAKQIASALEFLRSKDYIHRDLKPQNLLLNPSSLYYAKHGTPESMPLAADENSLVPAAGIESLPMLKIADFGFARILPTTSLAETLCGSPLYMAPEILRYEKYDAKADLWSIGTVLYEMMVARPPFRANNHVELLRRIEERNDHIKFTEGLVISREMKTLIRALLKRKPTERMSYESFFTSPVIRDEIPGLVEEDRFQEPEAEPAIVPKRAQKMPTEIDRRGSDNIYSQSPREKAVLGTTPPSRPSSRPTSGQYYGTPPRPTSARRSSNTPMAEQPVPVQRERRPTITSHVTAPAHPNVLQDRNPAPVAVTMDRRNSRNSPSPTSSLLKDNPDRERIPRRADERALREARERAAQDIAFERDYVLVEKRNVEINALADELAAIPHTARDRPSSPGSGGAMVRRATVQGSPTSATGPANPSRAIQIVSSRQPQNTAHQRTGSYERRYRPSFESATSALSKAMNMVNIRGLGISPPMIKGLSPPQGYSAFPTYPTAQSSLLLVGEGGKTTSSKDEDTKTIVTVEELAQRSHVVYGFAEVKYKQLIPATPSDQGLGIGTTGMVRKPSADAETAEDDDDLTIDAILQISEEALVLYVKALAILNRSMDLAGIWWNRRNRSDLGTESSSPRTQPTSNSPTALTGRMNHVVQWVRTRFNECCDKAEFVARKLQEAQKLLPLDHPNHPSNRSSASGSATTIGSAENIHLTTGVTAEKLMYDRALEMSRAAAVNELVGEDLPGCELNYWTAIRMLEAIVESDDDSPSRGKRDDDELINGLEAEDRQSVIKLLESMKARLKALKKKIELQKAAKRVSITGTPIPHPPSRSSPSSAGVAR